MGAQFHIVDWLVIMCFKSYIKIVKQKTGACIMFNLGYIFLVLTNP